MSVDAEGYTTRSSRATTTGPSTGLRSSRRAQSDRDRIIQMLYREDYAPLINNHVNGLFIDARSKSEAVA